MSRRNGIPFLGGPPPGASPVGLTVAQPLNDQQLVCLMASQQLQGVPFVTNPDPKAAAAERNEQAELAIVRSLDILGHVMYHMARGNVVGTIRQAVGAGERDAKAALEAEQSQAPAEEPEPAKRIIEGDG